MRPTLDAYIRSRCAELGLSQSQLARQTGLSRQTLHSLAQLPSKLPALQTLVSLAEALKVHPLRLVHLVFDEVPMVRGIGHTQHKAMDRSVFVRDVSYADGALVLPGQRFCKTWELQNLGTQPWEGRFLQCMDEDIMVYARSGETLHLAHNLIPSHSRVPVPTTAPGDLVQISVEFTAPEPPGTVLSYWKSVFADGQLCFPESRGLWVKVQITSMANEAVEKRSAMP